jgi:hypothetical protein
MIYLNAMKKILIIAVFFALISSFQAAALAQDYLKDLDSVRTSMTELGYKMPDLIKNAKPQDIRTLERVFEINNYAMVTIESYLKMIKMVLSSGGTVNKEVMKVLNGWLEFIKNYCTYDIKYLDDALTETKEKATIDAVTAQKNNILKLKDVSEKAIRENTEMVKDL